MCVYVCVSVRVRVHVCACVCVQNNLSLALNGKQISEVTSQHYIFRFSEDYD